MKIIFIRHAEPDYATDTLTEKGQREAQLLVERTKHWKVTDYYCSPLGRAQETARPTLLAAGREAVTYDWLQEFRVPDYNPDTMTRLWDLSPQYLNDNPDLFDPAKWLDTPLMSGKPVKEYYNRVMDGFDNIILAKYGYTRSGAFYTTAGTEIPTDHYMEYDGHTLEHMKDCKVEEPVIVIFCHLGVMLNIISHLINTTPPTLWQGFFVAPSSVTILGSEEREPGKAYFRCQTVGDTSHLLKAGEPVSYYGYFTPPFQG